MMNLWNWRASAAGICCGTGAVVLLHWWPFGAGIWCGAWAVVILRWLLRRLVAWCKHRMISREELAEQMKY